MSISVKRDLAGRYGLPSRREFRLGADTNGFAGGRYGAFVSDNVAEHNVRQLLNRAGITWEVVVPTIGLAVLTGGALSSTSAPALMALLRSKNHQKRIVREMARNFGLRNQADVDMFDDYWNVIHDGRNFAADSKDAIDGNLAEAYRMLGRLAANQDLLRDPPPPNFPNMPRAPENPVTWARIEDRSDFDHYVIFSDHHFTNLPEGRDRLNFALRDNYDLYLDVLDYYADRPEWCLVENGDVEECVIYKTDAEDAQFRKDNRGDMPVDPDDPEWDVFLQRRYEKRREALWDVFTGFDEYYTKINDRFIGNGTNSRYVRLTGNHDTYSDDDLERPLLDMIRQKLNNHPISDILRIKRGEAISHIVMHGHQFDSVSIQHGNINYAQSCGEVFSEATAWTNEGPDRYWDAHETVHWVHRGGAFDNTLARESPPDLHGGHAARMLAGVLANGLGFNFSIRRNTKSVVEALMKHEIGWEYYDHNDAFNALGLEVLTGDDALKFRHLNERNLVLEYKATFESLPDNGTIPTLILGHTHEPRHEAVNPSDVRPSQETDPSVNAPGNFYMNSGSAGRFHNLIWCVEVTPDGDRIVSWSRVRGQVQRTVWSPVATERQLPGGLGFTFFSSQLEQGTPEQI